MALTSGKATNEKTLETWQIHFREENERKIVHLKAQMEGAIGSLKRKLMENQRKLIATRTINLIVNKELMRSKYEERVQFTSIHQQLSKQVAPGNSEARFEMLMEEGKAVAILPEPIRLAYLFRAIGLAFLFKFLCRLSSFSGNDGPTFE